MEKYYKYFVFRPGKCPVVRAPITVRSVGHYCLHMGWSENRMNQDFWELFWLKSGQVQFGVQNRLITVKAPGIFLYCPGDNHRILCKSTPADYWWVTFDKESNLSWFPTQEHLIEKHFSKECPVSLFTGIMNLIDQPEVSAELHCAAQGFEILLHASTEVETYPEEKMNHPITAYMMKRAYEPDFGIDILADDLNMHRTTIYRMFKSRFGISPINYLQRLRLKRGMYLLKTTQDTIADVSLSAGFRDPAYFARLVRQSSGMSPKEIRERSHNAVLIKNENQMQIRTNGRRH